MKFDLPLVRRGMILPMILVLVLLLAISVMILTSFSSENRGLIIRSEKKLNCQLAAESAITEVRTLISSELSRQGQWSQIFRNLLPPHTSIPTEEKEVYASRTAQTYEGSVYVHPVRIRALVKHIKNGRTQGLLSFSVLAESSQSTFSSLRLLRVEHIRFVVSRDSLSGLSINLMPGADAVSEKSI